MNKLSPTPYQTRVLAIPETWDLFLGGGRGGGKTEALAWLGLRHIEQYGAAARVLYLRQTYTGLADFELTTRKIFGAAYGATASYNAGSHLWRLPSGATFELGQLECDADYAKYQGRSFTLLLVDELGQYVDPTLVDMVRSNLRGPRQMPLRTVYAANPGGVGHAWISARYALRGSPWRPCEDERSHRTFVYAPSTLEDNPHIDARAYRQSLEAACAADPELLRAWVEGDWSIARGAYFAGVLSEARNAIADVGPRLWTMYFGGYMGWSDVYLAHDFGSSAPSVTLVVARSPGADGPDGRYYPPGSLLLLDELATTDPQSVSRGLGWTVPVLADAIRDLCKRWGIRAVGVADDAIFAHTGSGAGCIADEFRRERVYFDRALKRDRVSGWAAMRRMLQDAGKPDRPGLYISRRCSYWWQTVPVLPRDPRRVEDLDTRAPDHAADATRYALCRWARPARVEHVGLW